jgi:hypothetical protein
VVSCRRRRFATGPFVQATLPLVAVGLLSVVLMTLGSESPAGAATPSHSLRVSPVKVELTLDPGETARQTAKVQNQGDTTFTVNVDVADYSVLPDASFVFSDPGHESYSCAKWISIGPRYFRLVPGEVREYPIDVRVPLNAEPGGNYGCVLFSVTSNAPKAGLTLNGRVGSLFLLTVSGAEPREEGVVGAFSVRKPLLSRQTDSQLTFVNKGNVHLNVIQTVAYTNFLGLPVGKVVSAPVTVLPGSKRYLQSRWMAPYFGWFEARSSVNYGPRLDTYNAWAESSKVAFWVVSPEAIAVVALFVIVVASAAAGGVAWSRRRAGPPRLPADFVGRRPTVT